MTKGFRGAATHSIYIGNTCALAACGKVVVFIRRKCAVIGSAWVHHDTQGSLAFAKRGSVTRSPTVSRTPSVQDSKTVPVAMTTPVPTKTGLKSGKPNVAMFRTTSTSSGKRVRREVSDYEGQGVPESVLEITGRLRKYCLSEQSKVNKSASEEILKVASEYDCIQSYD